jgi:hypothetical protein
MRNVVTLRLSAPEQEQIDAAARRLGKPLRSFLREAALEASARVEQKASPWWSRAQESRKAAIETTEPKPKEPETEPPELVVIDAEPHYVDGEPVYR